MASSFFFKRGDVTLSDPLTVWRTVAHDLTRYNGTIAKTLVDTLKGRLVNPEWPDIAAHFKYLIKEPLIHYSSSTNLAHCLRCLR
jgi:hypothetical protein